MANDTPSFIIETTERLLMKAGTGPYEYRRIAEGFVSDMRLILTLLTEPEA